MTRFLADIYVAIALTVMTVTTVFFDQEWSTMTWFVFGCLLGIRVMIRTYGTALQLQDYELRRLREIRKVDKLLYRLIEPKYAPRYLYQPVKEEDSSDKKEDDET